ncbi:MAG: gliding motility-associated C-terminal domain-containing protein, partial [Bacteroidales bacterium]|nr:gliding motility-associated C-terminal domain-containing protein [Bacteroidales bacterium]
GPWSIDLTSFESDYEDTNERLRWYLTDENTSLYTVEGEFSSDDVISFNPLPDAYDFIEIYNRSDKTIDLQELFVATYDMDEGGFKSVEQIIEEGYLLFPKSFVVLSEDPEIVKQQYYSSNPEAFIKIKSLPSLNDDEGVIYLLDKWQNVIDFMTYSESMQFPLLATAEGVSLERINYERPSEDKTNWHSASELVGFATPAYENSQFMELEDIEDEVNIEPEVFSPDNDGFEDVANISFTFDEPGYVANIKIFDSKGRLIRYLANNQLLGINGVITWDGLDDKNQKAPVGIYVVFIEIFDLDGNVKQFKKSVVIAAKW